MGKPLPYRDDGEAGGGWLVREVTDDAGRDAHTV